MSSSGKFLSRKQYSRLISIGRHCQTAYQIRRFTKDSHASYFDWMATPHEGLVHDLRTGFKGSFELSNLCLAENGHVVLDQLTGFSYRHAFPRLSYDDPIDWSIVQSAYAEVRSKREMLKQRWLSAAQNEKTLFIRHDVISINSILELHDALQVQTGGRKVGLLILCPQPQSTEILNSNIYVEAGFSMPSGKSDWKGEDAIWDFVLSKYWSRASRFDEGLDA